MYYLNLDEQGYVTAYQTCEIPHDELPEDSPLRAVPHVASLDGIDTDNMRAYRFNDGELVLDEAKKAELLAARQAEAVKAQIAEIKAKLTETDYAVIKIAEGASPKEQYADVIKQRRLWRDEINRLEATING